MKTLVLFLMMTMLQNSAFAASEETGSKLLGSWQLTKFLVIAFDGTSAPFCDGANGILIYEKSGYMSVAINCGPTGPRKVPADDFGGLLFYSGSFEEHAGSVTHRISNSTSPSLIGAEPVRKIETLTDSGLVLTGSFGSNGQTLYIEWQRLPLSAR